LGASARQPTPGLKVGAGEIHALIGPNGARARPRCFNCGLGLFETDKGTHQAWRTRGSRACPSDLICHRGLRRSFQITKSVSRLSIYENLRAVVAGAERMVSSVARHRRLREHSTPRTRELINLLGLEGIETIEKAANCPMAGSGWSTSAIALGPPSGRCCCLDEPLRGLPRRARAGLEPGQECRRQYSGADVEHDIDRVLGFSKSSP